MTRFVELKIQTTYGEFDQVNPLRWEVLYKRGRLFYVQTSKFKCKDFLNDFVPRFHGYNGVSIYGFTTKEEHGIKINKSGLWLRLTNIKDTDALSQTLANIVPKKFYSLEVIGNDTALLFLKKKAFSSTYYVSLIALIVRLGCYQRVFESLEQLIESIEYKADGDVLKTEGRGLALGWKFNIPKEYKEYFFFAGTEYSSKEIDPDDMQSWASIIHNNGVKSWADAIKGGY